MQNLVSFGDGHTFGSLLDNTNYFSENNKKDSYAGLLAQRNELNLINYGTTFPSNRGIYRDVLNHVTVPGNPETDFLLINWTRIDRCELRYSDGTENHNKWMGPRVDTRYYTIGPETLPWDLSKDVSKILKFREELLTFNQHFESTINDIFCLQKTLDALGYKYLMVNSFVNLNQSGRFANIINEINNIRYFYAIEPDKSFRGWARAGSFFETPCGHFKYDAHSRFAELLDNYIHEYNLING